MKTTMNYNQMVSMLYGYGQGYCGLTKEQYKEKKDNFKTIINEESKHGKTDFIVTLTDGMVLKLRMFVSSDDNVCFYKKGARTRGYMINLGKVERIEGKKKEQNKYRTFHRNCEKAARLLAASGFWTEIRKRMEVMAAMTEKDYNRLMMLWQQYDELYNHRELSYEERDRLQNEKQKEYLDYFTKRGVTGDWYHFRQLSENKQIVSVPYSNGGYIKERQLDCVRDIINQVKQGKADEYRTFYWYGNYDFHIEVGKNSDGSIWGWYSAEYKGCGNGHYYLLLDAEHAIYYEDD